MISVMILISLILGVYRRSYRYVLRIFPRIQTRYPRFGPPYILKISPPGEIFNISELRIFLVKKKILRSLALIELR